MDLFILGALATSCLIAAIFFLKFYRQTRDKLFLAFSIAFLLEAINRTALASSRMHGEGEPQLYLIRLVAYVVIIVGIISKNLRRP